MNTERLLKLADLLEADAANPQGVRFDLHFWAADASVLNEKQSTALLTVNEIGEGGFEPDTKVKINCDTAACAWGLAAISGVFAPDGLTYTIDGCGFLAPKFEGREAFGAAEKFFDIQPHTALRLFDPTYYNKTRGAKAELEVATRIRELVVAGVEPNNPNYEWDQDDDAFDPDEGTYDADAGTQD